MSRIVEFGKRNSTTILTIISMLGVVGTAVASGIAANKAAEEKGRALKLENEDTDVPNLTTVPIKLGYKEYVKRYWKYYIPAVGIGILTCGCIGMTESINKKRQTALIGACALTAEAFREYRETVKEVYGEEGEKKVQEEICKKHYDEHVKKPEGEEILFYDMLSSRYFNSTLENVQFAITELNRRLVLQDYVTLDEFYELLGLGKMAFSKSVGWCTWAESDYGYRWIDVELDKVVMDDGLECYILRYPFEPHTDFLEL